MQLEQYLKELFGEAVKVEPKANNEKIPLYLRNGYSLSVAEIHGLKVLFAKPAERETPATLRMHSEKLGEAFSLPCVAYLEEIDPQEKRYLLQNGTPFIVPGYLFFAPNIGVSLNEKIKEIVKTRVEKFTPLTQAVYLYMLHNRSMLTDSRKKQISYTLIGRETGLNQMTVKRAIDAFSAIGIARLTDDGVVFLCGRAEFIDKALSYLESPIKEKFYCTKKDFQEHINRDGENMTAADIFALQNAPCPYYISDGRRLAGEERAYALSKNNDKVAIPKEIKMKYAYASDDVEIQIWHYKPNIFEEAWGTVGSWPEPLSLYLSLRNTTDERVQGALEELLEGIKYDRRA